MTVYFKALAKVIKASFSFSAFILFSVCALTSCKKDESKAAEHVAAAKLIPTKDPVQEEIYGFRIAVRQDYNTRRFPELEKRASELRRTKALFGDGRWKLIEFYQAFACRREEPENMWQLHDQIHRDWLTAFPQSITARVAYGDFLTEYAWHARGSGSADTVTAEGWQRFNERLTAATRTVEEVRDLPERDPVSWSVRLRIATGQSWTEDQFDRALEEAKSFEPKFWGYDVSRAVSLLPRWYGKPGAWEEYAEHAATRPDGLGDEVYARIVMALHGYYRNVFRETKASWKKTEAGLEQMRRAYPQSLDILSEAASLAVNAEDREFAKAMFDLLGDRYLSSVWKKPEYFLDCRKWAGADGPTQVADSQGVLLPAQHTSAQPASTTWSARTIRDVRVKDDRQEILIPKDAQLRVIARGSTDVMIAYKGSTVTIPVSATDLNNQQKDR
jgi:hypothetical protein